MIMKLIKTVFKDFKKMWLLNVLVLFLLVFMFLIAISLSCTIQQKMKYYSALAPYLNKNGIYISTSALQLKYGPDDPSLVHDEKELKMNFSCIEDVLASGNIWQDGIVGDHTDVNLWCYNSSVLNILSPEMESGRWFNDSDTSDTTLKAVITHNENNITVGDTLEIKSNFCDATIKVKIIGIIKDKSYLYNRNETSPIHYDYRDCYYQYNYEAEGKPLIILSDAQILYGEYQGLFKELNYRLDRKRGLQKEIKGPVILTFKGETSQEEIDTAVERLKQYSTIETAYPLSKLKQGSISYILEELHDYFPVFLCILIFVLVAVVSINTITVKKQMHSYAIYYLCGLPWRSCARISLLKSCMMSGAALFITAFGIYSNEILGYFSQKILYFGWLQAFVCLIIMAIYVTIAWIIPLHLIQKTSAKQVLYNN